MLLKTRLFWFLAGAAAAGLSMLLLSDASRLDRRAAFLPQAAADQGNGAGGQGRVERNASTPESARRETTGLAGAAAGSAAQREAAAEPAEREESAEGEKLRIICFGAHPDDCELRAAGVAAMWAERGHHVKFVSVTNGDIGHWQMAGGPLAQRRTAEVERCAEILGIETEVLDIHDGELLPTLVNRKTITRLIREWKADIVMCHRPNDYHPDHRNVGLLVQDAAYMVTVPFFCPDIPRLEKNPVFLYFEDRFQKPNPFAPDMVVAIDDVIQKKMAAVEALESQFFEGGCCSGLTEIPTGAAAAARKKAVYDNFLRRFGATADRFRSRLVQLYGKQAGEAVSYAEAFEVCEYGRRPSAAELRELFPIEAPQAP